MFTGARRITAHPRVVAASHDVHRRTSPVDGTRAAASRCDEPAEVFAADDETQQCHSQPTHQSAPVRSLPTAALRRDRAVDPAGELTEVRRTHALVPGRPAILPRRVSKVIARKTCFARKGRLLVGRPQPGRAGWRSAPVSTQGREVGAMPEMLVAPPQSRSLMTRSLASSATDRALPLDTQRSAAGYRASRGIGERSVRLGALGHPVPPSLISREHLGRCASASRACSM